MVMAVRLTNSIRDSLMEALMRRAFKEQCEDWARRFGKFVVKVHDDIYGEADLGRMKALPDGWLPKSRELKVRFGGDAVRLSTTGEFNSQASYSVQWPDEFRACDASKNTIVLMLHTYDNNDRQAAVYDARDPMADEYTGFMNELQDLKEKISGAQRTARAALNSVHTIQKLIEVWPEVEEFAKQYLVHGERKALLPDIPRAQLNAVLGLPPSESVSA